MQQDKIETAEIDRRRGMFREMIKNEEALINRRLTWLLAMQAFLFTGLYYSMQNSHKDVAVVIFYAVAIIGYPISLLILSALIASVKAFKRTNEAWVKVRPVGYDGPDIFGLAPEFPKGLTSIMPYMSAENSVAFAFTFFWLISFIFEAHGGAFPGSFVVFALSVFLTTTAGVVGFWLKDIKSKSSVLVWWLIVIFISVKICFFIADGLKHNEDHQDKKKKSKSGISMDFLK